MAEVPNKPHQGGQQSEPVAVRNVGRRRWLQAGVSAAPVVMTVVSKPVLALSTQCDSPSGFTSLSVSHPGPGLCAGYGPTYWNNHPANWPTGFTPATLFGAMVGFGPPVPQLANMPIGIILNPASGFSEAYVIARLIIAAYFNAVAIPALTSVATLSAAGAADIWRQYSASGHYSPRPGFLWNPSEIVAYLQSTMPNP